jgi:hypothetical protein
MKTCSNPVCGMGRVINDDLTYPPHAKYHWVCIVTNDHCFTCGKSIDKDSPRIKGGLGGLDAFVLNEGPKPLLPRGHLVVLFTSKDPCPGCEDCTPPFAEEYVPLTATEYMGLRRPSGNPWPCPSCGFPKHAPLPCNPANLAPSASPPLTFAQIVSIARKLKVATSALDCAACGCAAATHSDPFTGALGPCNALACPCNTFVLPGSINIPIP